MIIYIPLGIRTTVKRVVKYNTCKNIYYQMHTYLLLKRYNSVDYKSLPLISDLRLCSQDGHPLHRGNASEPGPRLTVNITMQHQG
jgi:hypothetical protein